MLLYFNTVPRELVRTYVTMANQTNLRIGKEIKGIQAGNDLCETDLCVVSQMLTDCLAISVAFRDENVRHVRAMILGPQKTPYEYGFFEFDVKFDNTYPSTPPKVNARTTNNGRTRFNPNIYAGGKVCLSILGTWHGELPGEDWSSAQGLESVLWSIQSLMDNNPYGNEPGFEGRETDDDVKKNELYCAKIRHETVRVSVIQKIESIMGVQADGSRSKVDEDKWVKSESDSDTDDFDDRKPWEPFEDWQKRRFLWYYQSYLDTIDANTPKVEEGEKFTRMPFEGSHNEMAGTFQYAQLRTRLIKCKELIDQETVEWVKQGLEASNKESNKAYTLRSQYHNVRDSHDISNIEISLEDDNPFIWIMSYFGKQETPLEGGAFKIRISSSTGFPAEQPRVKVITPISHHRVAPDGTLCYFPTKPEDMKNHIQSIVASLEEKDPPYDPRTVVNPELSRLFFGSADEKKKYNRLQRRSAEASMDYDG